MKLIETEMNQEIFGRIKSETQVQRATFKSDGDAYFLKDDGFSLNILVPKYFQYPKLYTDPITGSYAFKVPNDQLDYNDRLFRSLVFYKGDLYVFIIPSQGSYIDWKNGPEGILKSYQKTIPNIQEEELKIFLQAYYRIVGSDNRGWKDNDRHSQYVPIEIQLTSNWWGE